MHSTDDRKINFNKNSIGNVGRIRYKETTGENQRDINHIYFQSCSFYDHSTKKIMWLYLDLSWDSICGEVITFPGSDSLIKQTDSNYTREIKVYRPNRDKFNDHSKFYGTISIIKVVLDVDIYDGAHFFQIHGKNY